MKNKYIIISVTVAILSTTLITYGAEKFKNTGRSLSSVNSKTEQISNKNGMNGVKGQKPNKKPESKPGGDRIPPEFNTTENRVQDLNTENKTKKGSIISKDKNIEKNNQFQYPFDIQPSYNMNRQSPTPPPNYSK